MQKDYATVISGVLLKPFLIQDIPMLAVGKSFLHYTIEKELGRGGMGVVYKAFDNKLQRAVALKVIREESGICETAVKRFMREARATAKLKHPGIVEVYEVGEIPQNYFTMEYVDGEPLVKLMGSRQFSAGELAQIMKKCAQALFVAHQNQIIHRDIKPSNIMLGPKMEPRITDFGLAKVLSAKQQLSYDGQILGTLAYMSPEQASDNKVSPRSDIYSLGVTMYRVLTGKRPFQGDTTARLLNQIFHEEPLLPRTWNQNIPADLEAICLKCLKKNPKDRYFNARMLARDLDHFLQGKPITAQPATKWTLATKWAFRNRVVVTVSLGAFVFTVIALSIALWEINQHAQRAMKEARKAELAQWQAVVAAKRAKELEKKAREEAEYARRAEAEAMSLREQARLQRYFTNILLADKYYEDQQVREAIAVLQECPQDLRGWEWRWLRGRGHFRHKLILEKKRVVSCAVSPDGNKVVSASADGTLVIWDTRGKKLQTIYEENGRFTQCAFTADGKYLISAGVALILWDLDTGEKKKIFQYPVPVKCFSLSPDGKKIVAGYGLPDGSNSSILDNLIVWDIASAKKIHSLGAYMGSFFNDVVCCSFSPNGKIIISGGENQDISADQEEELLVFWSAISGKRLATRKGHREDVNSLAFSPDGKTMITASDDRTLLLWDTKNFRQIARLRGHTGAVTSCAFSDDGRRIVSASTDKDIIIWDVQTRRRVATVNGHEATVNACVFVNDDKFIFSASNDHTLRIWNVERIANRNPFVFPKQKYNICKCTFHPAGNMVASATEYEMKIRLWNVQSGREIILPPFAEGKLKPFVGHYSSVRTCAFSPDGRTIVTAGTDGLAMLWEVDTGRPLITFEGHAKANDVHYCSFSPDNTRIATSCADGTIRIWDAQVDDTSRAKNSFKPLFRESLLVLKGHEGTVNSISFSPDSKKLVSCGNDGTAKLWDIQVKNAHKNIEERFPLMTFGTPQHRGKKIYYCTFNQRGDKIATAGAGKTNNLFVWDVVSLKKPLLNLKGHRNDVYCCKFSPDGKRLVSGGFDGTLKIWNVRLDMDISRKILGRPMLTIAAHTAAIQFCTFNQNGDKLISGGKDKIIKMWEIIPWEN